MTALMKIQSFIQAYVKAIASILDVDVTIVDNELVRVAGTGIYAGRDWQNCDSREFFSSYSGFRRERQYYGQHGGFELQGLRKAHNLQRACEC